MLDNGQWPLGGAEAPGAIVKIRVDVLQTEAFGRLATARKRLYRDFKMPAPQAWIAEKSISEADEMAPAKLSLMRHLPVPNYRRCAFHCGEPRDNALGFGAQLCIASVNSRRVRVCNRPLPRPRFDPSQD